VGPAVGGPHLCGYGLIAFPNMWHTELPGPLFPGSEGEAAVLLDSYLSESHERARSVTIDDLGYGEVMGKSGPSRSGLERS
jgi:hypothetical protein